MDIDTLIFFSSCLLCLALGFYVIAMWKDKAWAKVVFAVFALLFLISYVVCFLMFVLMPSVYDFLAN